MTKEIADAVERHNHNYMYGSIEAQLSKQTEFLEKFCSVIVTSIYFTKDSEGLNPRGVNVFISLVYPEMIKHLMGRNSRVL